MENVPVKKASKAKKSNNMNPMMIVMAVVVVLALGVAAFFWNDARSARNETPDAIAERNQEESVRVIEALNSVLLTESDGDPTVARVEDASVLREANEEFYKNAATGDYLVLYPQRAILFREDERRVINVAPIINTDQLRANTQGTTPAEGSAEQPAAETAQ